MEIVKLDNPAWYSLSETHREFLVGYDDLKFYHPDYCPFGGGFNSDKAGAEIGAYASLIDDFFFIGDKPDINDEVRVESELICDQMILDKSIDIDINENIIQLETDDQKDQLFELVNLV